MPRYKRQYPNIVDPAGVHLGVGPRPMGMTSDQSRRGHRAAGAARPLGWLQHVTGHRFFPELWSIRTQF